MLLRLLFAVESERKSIDSHEIICLLGCDVIE